MDAHAQEQVPQLGRELRQGQRRRAGRVDDDAESLQVEGQESWVQDDGPGGAQGELEVRCEREEEGCRE